MKKYLLKTAISMVLLSPIAAVVAIFEVGVIYGDYRDFLITLAITSIVSPLIFLYELKSFRYKFEETKDFVENIEIVDVYSTPEMEHEFLKISINSKDINVFLQELSELDFKHGFPLFGNTKPPSGVCIKLFNKDLSYEYINGKVFQKFSHEDKEISLDIRRCPVKDFENLISKFVK